jgi:glycosyltransferase involved in cell wall biosynthesis
VNISYRANKILLFIKTPPPLTGATLVNKYVFDSKLLRNAFDVREICVSYAKGVSELGKFNFRKIGTFLHTYFKYLNKVICHRPDIVYFQPSLFGVAYYRDLTFILTGRLLGLNFILHLHGKGIADAASKSPFKTRLYKLGFSNQYLIVYCDKQKKDIEFTNPRKIFTIHNGIPDFAGSLDSKVDTSSRFRFLFLSNLLKSKGVYDLIASAKQLLRLNDQFVIDVVGAEGDIRVNDLESLINDSGLANTIFLHGPKYNEDKIYYLRNADAFVFPTLNEAFGLVILEAMQFSLPVIATNENAIPDLVCDGTTGFVINKGDIDALTKKMKYLMDNRNIAKKMGMNGRKLFEEKFTLEIFEKKMLNIFNEILRMQT